MTTPFDHSQATVIGEVESVAPTEIKVLLDIDTPKATALNTGTPVAFPRLNGYVVIPVTMGLVVGLVTWIGIERSQFPRRAGLRDFGLVDLPFPLRKLSVTPLGTLRYDSGLRTRQGRYTMERGVSDFPSVGDTVHIPTTDQLLAIVESQGSNARINLGTSPMAADAKVSVDPDRLLGRHLAVLGNTGSGKSCTVAGIVRWSLEAAEEVRRANGLAPRPNARFIILDPNGEYAEAFSDIDAGVRVFQVPPGIAEECLEFKLPAWMWNSIEWTAFAEAAPRVQRPLLLRALRDLKGDVVGGTPAENNARRGLTAIRRWLLRTHHEGNYAQFPALRNIHLQLEAFRQDLGRFAAALDGDQADAIALLDQEIEAVLNRRQDDRGRQQGFNDTDFTELIAKLENALSVLPHALDTGNGSEDAPIPFRVQDFAAHLEYLASTSFTAASPFVDSLSMRIRGLITDSRKKQVLVPDDQMTLAEWLESYVGKGSAENGAVCVIDLSLVPQDVMHMVVAVLGRLVFEATQRFRRVHHATLPTTLVLEEAHAFISRGADADDGIPTPAQMCRHVFERIAREGRKFGLGLVLSSQRPSELSPTVLSQCNTFILHRIVNDRDQDLVGRLVPDNVAGLLRELPSLPSRQAILLGWAAPVPVLMEVRHLPEAHRPNAPDPNFWDVWTGEVDRVVDWSEIVRDWTGDRGGDEG